MTKNHTKDNYDNSDLPEDLLIGIANVYKIYRSAEIETVALRGVSLSLFEGEIMGVIGPSGSGKSTLVNIMAGLIKPTAGIVYWSSVRADIARMPDNFITQIRNQFIGIICQISESNLLPHLSVIENVLLQGQIGNLNRTELKKHALELLDRVGLRSRQNSKPMVLSMGERQRIALAAALINKPKIILADEPTGSLDYKNGEEFLELIHEINENLGTAFLIVTHSQQVVPHTHRIIELRDGIKAGQHEEIELDNLDYSRIIIPDDQGRILLPQELITRFDTDTSHFKAVLKDGKIVLEPIVTSLSRKSIIFQRRSHKEIACPVCKTVNIGKSILCSNCGSLLRKAGRWST
ncbi:MAG: ABC transporter ATP-binding protein [Promethearchaeota archaeon]